MRKVSLAERRTIVAEYKSTLKSTSDLAQQFRLEKLQVADILRQGGVVRPCGRPLVLPFSSNAAADGRAMIVYRHTAREHGAIRRLDEMMTELRSAQSESGRTYLAGLIARDQRSPKGRVRLTLKPGRPLGELREG